MKSNQPMNVVLGLGYLFFSYHSFIAIYELAINAPNDLSGFGTAVICLIWTAIIVIAGTVLIHLLTENK